ncbi:hypothetical protein CAC42_3569 [Sphaceloma murrayae]|uniref:Uncharacterized protein n=1 Tax=Sphaceloma murrayae TaxID=2082308 RepID=A0A2K1QSS1_9PEZI|nr:hypothetical protein CAC42_3569 [Sphaceloma murrayae]
MEAFGAAASAVQLADIALRLFQNLCDFVNNARTADTAAKELRDKVESLWTTITTVKSVIKLREESLQRRPLSDDEKRVRRTLQKDILVCTRVLEQFETALHGLLRDHNHPAWLGKTLLQLQLEKRDAAIRRLENFIDTRLQMLQVSLACLQVLVDAGNHQDVLDRLNNLSLKISKSQDTIVEFRHTRESIQSRNSEHRSSAAHDSAVAIDDHLEKVDVLVSENETSIEKDFRDLLEAATEIHRAGSVQAFSERHSDDASIQQGGEASRPRIFSTSEYSHLLARPAILSPSVLSLEPSDPIRADPTPGFDDTTHLEPLEALIERLCRQAEEDTQRAWYNQAEQHQKQAITLLQERYVGYGIAFDTYEEMQTLLADIYDYQQKHDTAQEIRHALLRGETDFVPPTTTITKAFVDSFPDPARALKSAVQYHSLARSMHDRYRYHKDHRLDPEDLLEIAERDAKRAFKLRRHFTSISDPQFLSTVDLLLKIYDAQEKTLYHDVYFRLYFASQAAISSPSLQSVSPRTSLSRIESNAPSIPLRQSTALSISERHLELQTTQTRADSAQGGDPLYGTYTNVAGATDESKIYLDPHAARTDLKKAVRRGDVRSVSTLLDRSGQHQAHVTLALVEATRLGNHEIVKLLLEKKDAKPDTMNESGEYALHVAAQYGHLTIVQQLLDARANPNLAGSDGWTAIHFAVHGKHERVLFTLFNNPLRAHIDARNMYGDTGLHLAAEQGEFHLADILIRAGATPSIRNNGDLTALEAAIDNRRETFVRAWLAAGIACDVDWDRVDTSPYIRFMVNEHMAGQSEESIGQMSPPPPSPRSPTLPSGRERQASSIGSVASTSPGRQRRSFSRLLSRRS